MRGGKREERSTTNSQIMENRHQTPDFRHQPRGEGNNNELHEREENNL
jgi:hypothetical protein